MRCRRCVRGGRGARGRRSSRFSSLFLRLRGCGCRNRSRNDKKYRDACVPLEHDTDSRVAPQVNRRDGTLVPSAQALHAAYKYDDLFIHNYAPGVLAHMVQTRSCRL
jgi:hypothetical protein